jgi:putative transposase
MNAPKVTDTDYIQFLIAAQRVYTCTEAARCAATASHDAYTRLLSRLPPDTAALWQEVEPLVQKTHGLLVVDDTTLANPYAQKMGLVTRHWSGKHHAVVSGINLMTFLWTDALSNLPCDCRLYEPAEEGKEQITKNDHFLAMLKIAKEREFCPRYVCFDGWYASLANLKALRGHSWHFLTRLKHNRQVDPDDTGNVAVENIEIPPGGRRVHLKGYGFILVFRIVALNADTQQAEHWATSDLSMMEITRDALARQVFAIENYHRQLKQCCGVEGAQVRSVQAQKCHIVLSLQAFVSRRSTKPELPKSKPIWRPLRFQLPMGRHSILPGKSVIACIQSTQRGVQRGFGWLQFLPGRGSLGHVLATMPVRRQIRQRLLQSWLRVGTKAQEQHQLRRSDHAHIGLKLLGAPLGGEHTPRRVPGAARVLVDLLASWRMARARRMEPRPAVDDHRAVEI